MPGGTALALQGARVLLAEDNPINQEVALELLTAQGARVDVADDGRAALALASSRRYDLVLMDVQMPHLDGLAATQALRRMPGWAQVPIVAMTASAFSDDREECLAAGMNDVLVKPVEPEALIDCMRHWRQWSGGQRPAAALLAPQPAVDPAAAEPADPRALRQALQALRPLLLSHDTAAIDQIDRDQAVLRRGPTPLFAPLSAHVRAFAFGPALALLDEALATLDAG
jgi:CheY-like chemotaxis protein